MVSDRSQEVVEEIRRMMPLAKEALDRHLSNLPVGITNILDRPKGVSRSTGYRRFRTSEASRYRSVEAWTLDLKAIYLQIVQIYKDLGEEPPEWSDVFGDEIPPPSVLGAPATFNRSRIQSVEIRKTAEPLIEALKAAYTNIREEENPWKAGQVLVQLCGLLELTENWSVAEEYLGHLVENNHNTNDFHFEADAHLRRGIARYFLDKLPQAIRSIDAGLDVIAANEARSPPLRTKLRLLNYKATLTSKTDAPLALRILQIECLPLAQQSGSHAALGSVHNRIGQIELDAGNPTAAVPSLEAALLMRLGLHMHTEASKTLYSLAQAEHENERAQQAVVLLDMAVRLQRRHQDFDVLGLSLLALGKALLRLSDEQLPLRFTPTPSLFTRREILLKLEDLSRLLGSGDRCIRNPEEARQEAVRSWRAALTYGPKAVVEEAEALLSGLRPDARQDQVESGKDDSI